MGSWLLKKKKKKGVGGGGEGREERRLARDFNVSAILVHNPSHLFTPLFCRVRRTMLTEETKPQHVLLTFSFLSINPHSLSLPQIQICMQLLLLLASGYNNLASKLPLVTCR